MIPVDAETIKAVYVMLRSFPPFKNWNLPPPEKMNFAAEPLKSMWGDFNPETHTIRISTLKITTFLSLLITVAHEMVHLKQDVSGKWPARDAHNAHFKKLAAQVCKHFPFADIGNF